MNAAPDLARITAARLKLARMMVDLDRPQFAPILHRLSAERAAIEEGQRALSDARAILEAGA